MTKINREVTFDKYGRMIINEEVFFPFGAFVMGINESNLIDLNKTHFNFILPYVQLKKEIMDMIYNKLKGKIKVMYSVKDMYTYDKPTCTDLKEEENYEKFVQKIEEFKNHPLVFSWYVNDEITLKVILDWLE